MQLKDIFSLLYVVEIYISKYGKIENHENDEHFYIISQNVVDAILEKYGNKIVKQILALWENIILIVLE